MDTFFYFYPNTHPPIFSDGQPSITSNSNNGSGFATTVTGGGTAVTGGNVIGATKNSNSGKTVTSGSHEKDSTPKTGDGINPVFFLCIGVLLVGVYFVVSNRKKAA